MREIVYGGKGQRILLAMKNGMMTRYAYDDENFRLLRTKSEKFTLNGHTYSPNGGTQQDLGYAYDREGTIMAIKDDAPANGSTTQEVANRYFEWGYADRLAVFYN